MHTLYDIVMPLIALACFAGSFYWRTMAEFWRERSVDRQRRDLTPCIRRASANWRRPVVVDELGRRHRQHPVDPGDN